VQLRAVPKSQLMGKFEGKRGNTAHLVYTFINRVEEKGVGSQLKNWGVIKKQPERARRTVEARGSKGKKNLTVQESQGEEGS